MDIKEEVGVGGIGGLGLAYVHSFLSPRLFFIILFIFGFAGSLLLHGLFSSCREQGLLSSCGCGLLTAVALLQSTGSRAHGFQ